MPAIPPYDEHLIINTHWDREWRWSFRETQLRLVQAMDLLLDTMERDPRFHAFHTDSQSSMVDDYLEMRPENADRVRRLVQAGRLLIGPWYTLPAHFLVSGEALVRNLLLGHRIAAAHGGVMKVAYNIFSWGQVSQLPQIYRQFGMDTIVFYRGVDQSALPTLEFWWEGRDGKRSLGITFGSQHRLNFWSFVYKPFITGSNKLMMSRDEGRGFLVNLSDPYSIDINHWMQDQICAADESSLAANMTKLVETVRTKSSTPHLLFFQGFDLENPDPIVPDLVAKINQLPGGTHRLKVSTLPEYLKLQRETLEREGMLERLPVLKGEMLAPERVNASFGDLFAQVFSARMPVKLANVAAEIRLAHWAEPAAVWALMLGQEYPSQQLRTAWKELLKNQQHDGIGGAHNDRVTETMAERYRDVRDLAEATCRLSLQHVTAQVDCAQLSERETGVLVYNAGFSPRPGVVECVVDFPSEYLSGDAVFARMGGFVTRKQVSVRSAAGEKCSLQILDQWEELVFTYRRFGAHHPQSMRRFRVAFDAGNVPPCGYAGFIASVQNEIQRPLDTLSPAPNVLENEHLRVSIYGDGSFDLLHKGSGRVFQRQHVFLDEAEMGNPLLHVVPPDEGAFTTLDQPARVSLVRSGPLTATYRITREWQLPEALETVPRIWPAQVGEWVEPGRPRRSERLTALKITTEITLERDSRIVSLRTTVDNQVRDHRLRLLFPTGLDPVESVADSPFDVVRRPVAVPDTSGWREPALRQWPMSSWVDVHDRGHGLAFLHRWVGEYEVMDNHQGTLAITLLRCFSAPGGLGETHQAQSLAQCPGVHTFEYALYPHQGDWESAGVCDLAGLFRTPVRVAQTTRHSGSAPFAGKSFLELTPHTGLVVTALKKAEEEGSIVLRCYNPGSISRTSTCRCAYALAGAQLMSLEEKNLGDLTLSADRHEFTFTVLPGEIVTLALMLAQ
jgi:alpha-mannosidase